MKPGFKTSEFWVTVAVGTVGVIFVTLGENQLGALLLAAAGVSYSGSRGLAKGKQHGS